MKVTESGCLSHIRDQTRMVQEWFAGALVHNLHLHEAKSNASLNILSQDTLLRGMGHHRRTNTTCFHLSEVREIVKLTGTERSVVAREKALFSA